MEVSVKWKRGDVAGDRSTRLPPRSHPEQPGVSDGLVHRTAFKLRKYAWRRRGGWARNRAVYKRNLKLRNSDRTQNHSQWKVAPAFCTSVGDKLLKQKSRHVT